MKFQSFGVENVFLSYVEPYKSALLEVRELIFKIAKTTEGVGELSESLKWGQPTYTTYDTGSGTPIRIDKFEDGKIAIFFHCQTNLIEQIREVFKKELKFSKNRAIVLDATKNLPIRELEFCISSALIYHRKSIGKNGL